MRRLVFLLIPMCLLLCGCNQPRETVPGVIPTSGTTVVDDPSDLTLEEDDEPLQ